VRVEKNHSHSDPASANKFHGNPPKPLGPRGNIDAYTSPDSPSLPQRSSVYVVGIEQYPKRLSVASWSVTRPAECFATPQLGIGANLEFTSFSRALCRQIRAKRRIGLY